MNYRVTTTPPTSHSASNPHRPRNYPHLTRGLLALKLGSKLRCPIEPSGCPGWGAPLPRLRECRRCGASRGGGEERGGRAERGERRSGYSPRCAAPGRLLFGLPNLFPSSIFFPLNSSPLTGVLTHSTVQQTILFMCSTIAILCGRMLHMQR